MTSSIGQNPYSYQHCTTGHTCCDKSFNSQAFKVHKSVVFNDANPIKGLLWALAAVKIGALAIGAGIYALHTFPLVLLPPLTVIPIVLALASAALANFTADCINNAVYHLAPRKVVVVQQY